MYDANSMRLLASVWELYIFEDEDAVEKVIQFLLYINFQAGKISDL